MTGTVLMLDTPAGIFTKKERILYFLLLLFFAGLYAPGITWLYNVIMWCLFVYTFFFNTLAEKWQLLKKRPAILFMLLFFLLNVISAAVSANGKEGLSWVGIRISLLALPFSMGSIYIRSLLKDRIVLGFIVITVCAAFGSLLFGIAQAIRFHDVSLLYNDNLSSVLNLQSIYFAMLINIALLGLAYLQLKKSVLISKYTWLPVLLILLPVHFLLASRIAIGILYSLIGLYILYLIVYQKKIRRGISIAAGMVAVAALLFLFFPKTLNRFKELGYTNFKYNSTATESHYNGILTPDQWNGANLRIAVWECAWTVTTEHCLLGTGLGDKMDDLKKQYAKKGFVFGIQSNRNVHNTFLDVWMSMGLLGLLVFLSGFFILPGADAIRGQDWYGLVIITCLFISMITESYLDRTFGCTIMAFFLSFIASCTKPVERRAGY